MNTFTRSPLCAILSLCITQCIHGVECQKSSACWHILCYGTELYLSAFLGPFPDIYPADPTRTSCSSAPGWVGWLRGYVANPCSLAQWRSTMSEFLALCTEPEPPLPGITKPEDLQQHSTECMAVEKTHCF